MSEYSEYKEIFKLKEMLEKEHIPFSWTPNWGYGEDKLRQMKSISPDIEHYQICYPHAGDDRWISVIEGYGTFGAECDKLEIMGGFTEEESGGDSVLGHLTADDVFNRIKNHYYGGKIVMKKTIKVVDEDTLELKEVEVDIEESDEVYDDFAKQLRIILNCEPEELVLKYKAMKQAETEFKDLYEPFKEKLIEIYSKTPDLPKSIVMGGVAKFTYVSPSTRNTIDRKKLKEEEPELAKKYTKTTNVKATLRLEEL